MLNLAWGGFQNGFIPDSAMSPIDNQGHMLEHCAAARFLAMQAAMLHDLGRTITVAPGDDSAFRTIAQQQADYQSYLNGGNVASAPGHSNHGWGRAVDITGYEVHDDVWAWLLAHAAEYGFSHVTGAASGERWHWESVNTPSAIASVSSKIIPTRKRSTAMLYYTTDTQGRIFAIAGTSPGTPANWLETRDQNLANALAGAVSISGNAIQLTPATYESWKGLYLAPLATHAG